MTRETVTLYRPGFECFPHQLFTDDVVSVPGWEDGPLMRVRALGHRIIVWDPVPGQGLPEGQITTIFEDDQVVIFYHEQEVPPGTRILPAP